MPIYEYRCADCQHKLEALQKFSDAPLSVCPVCGHHALQKLVSAAGFQLKGSGWYQTDFRGGGSPKKTDKSEGGDTPAAETTAKTETSGDKPASTSTTTDTAAAKPAPAAPASSSTTP